MSRPRTIPAGARSGRLVATEERTAGQPRVKCRCDCGKDHTVRFRDWGRTQSCGCLLGNPRTIPVGERFGRLVVTEERTAGQARVRCRCDCGTDHSVLMTEWGRTRSCGCLKDEATAQRSYRHGHAGTSIYWTWADMVGRCTNPNHKRWADYGGRGITVCDRWRDFANFLADMGERPPGLELDRIDNDGGYEPDNCRWTDRSTQAKNRRPYSYYLRSRDPQTGRYLSEEAV